MKFVTLFLIALVMFAAVSAGSGRKARGVRLAASRQTLAEQIAAGAADGPKRVVDPEVQRLIDAAAAKAALDALQGADDEDSDSQSDDDSDSHDDDDDDSSSSSDDDDDSSSDDDDDSDSDDNNNRRIERQRERDLRDARLLRAAQAAQAAAELNPFPLEHRANRASYQARLTGGASARDPQEKFGPAIMIAKASRARAVVDEFDGNNDGVEDVKEGADLWSWNEGNKQRPGEFVMHVRNRASVNGGSIDLRALVASGRDEKGKNWAHFDHQRILITPCFPVTFELDFNVEVYVGTFGPSKVYAEARNLEGNFPNDAEGTVVDDCKEERKDKCFGQVAGRAFNTWLQVRHPECEVAGVRKEPCVKDDYPSVPGAAFWTVQPDGEVTFVEETAAFTLERAFGTDPAVVTTNQPLAHEQAGTITFSKCNQWSYFN